MMSVDLALLVAMGAMFAGGIYMLLERTLTRILLGIMLITNASIMLLLVTGGRSGDAPIRIEGKDPATYSDPLPQALMLTAIVIGFAVTAFLVAMIYRSWLLSREDVVAVDPEDVKVATQETFDAEEDAELEEETSEFLDDSRDPNADYEHTSERRRTVREIAARRNHPAGRPGAARPAGQSGASKTTDGAHPADTAHEERDRP